MTRLTFLVLATLGNVLLSRRSLPETSSHGFHRFFAFEFLAGLLLLNLPHWFRRPLAPRQLLSWPSLVASAALAGHGFYLLRLVGRPRGRAEGALIPGFEDTSQLVRVGAYRYIRHPLYSSLLLLGLGAWLKDPSRLATNLLVGAAGFLVNTALAEEKENAGRFGPAYEEYRRQTRLFVPGVF